MVGIGKKEKTSLVYLSVTNGVIPDTAENGWMVNQLVIFP